MNGTAAVSIAPGAYAAPAGLAVLRRGAFAVGAAAAAACLAGAWLDRGQFFRSYLVAVLYWLSIAVGCSAIGMLHHLTRGGWGLMIRRVLEAASGTLPLVALFFAPLLFGLGDLYRWARPDEVRADAHLRHQAIYLNEPFFIVRAALYFAIWCGFAWVLGRLSARQDQGRDPGLARRMQIIAAPGLVLYCLTATFASIDWLMSLDSRWYSTIYGVYFVGGHAIAGMSFAVLVALYLSARGSMSKAFRPIHFHDYGKLLLTFVVLWAYFAVSQLIIIWSGNLAEEITWYRGRLLGGWSGVSLALVALHFALPFLLLLSREGKRNAGRLSAVAILLLVMRWVDLHWLAAPAFSPERPAFHWLDAATAIALGGLWIGAFAGRLGRRPLLPVGDPGLAEALSHE
jgi:hypothetical protein